MGDQQMTDGGIQGQLAQISMELGRQSTQLAVITTKLDALTNNTTDHESRIRSLETQASNATGGRDLTARIVGSILVVGTWAGVVVVFVHH